MKALNECFYEILNVCEEWSNFFSAPFSVYVFPCTSFTIHILQYIFHNSSFTIHLSEHTFQYTSFSIHCFNTSSSTYFLGHIFFTLFFYGIQFHYVLTLIVPSKIETFAFHHSVGNARFHVLHKTKWLK